MRKLLTWNFAVLAVYLVLNVLSVLSENIMSESSNELMAMTLFASLFLIFIQMNYTLLPIKKGSKHRIAASFAVSSFGVFLFWAITYSLNWYLIYPYIVWQGLFVIR